MAAAYGKNTGTNSQRSNQRIAGINRIKLWIIDSQVPKQTEQLVILVKKLL